MVDGSDCTSGKGFLAYSDALRGFTRFIPFGAIVVYLTRFQIYTLTAPFHGVTKSDLRGTFLRALFTQHCCCGG